MRYPTLGLAVAPLRDPALLTLLTYMRRWCAVRQADATEPVDAWMVTDEADPSLFSPNARVLVWTRDPATAAERWGHAGVLVGPWHPGAHQVANELSFPDPGVDATASQFVAPVVRRRWRTSLGLPLDMIVRVGGGGDVGLPPGVQSAAMAVASVVLAVGDTVLTSMAWGAPTVTDLATADRLGLGNAVIAVSEPELQEAGRALSHDDATMSYLAWQGRQQVESRHDIAQAAYAIAQAAKIVSVTDLSWGVLTQLYGLWAPPATASSMLRAISAGGTASQ